MKQSIVSFFTIIVSSFFHFAVLHRMSTTQAQESQFCVFHPLVTVNYVKLLERITNPYSMRISTKYTFASRFWVSTEGLLLRLISVEDIEEPVVRVLSAENDCFSSATNYYCPGSTKIAD